ncbi:MAG: YfjI family protein [Planctomycetaceae bacterium]|nr:YfjI family protein [Planctomycetaceae bacterium]
MLSLQEEADKRYKEFLTKFESAPSIYNADFALWKGNRKKNPDGQPPEKPTPPIAQAYLADDTTPEALVEILEQNPFGVSLPKDGSLTYQHERD